MGTMDGVVLSSSEVEVMAKPVRRRFTGEDKLKILGEAEASSGSGQIGALLRREGLFSSNLTQWRKQRERGELEGLKQKRRGPLPKGRNPLRPIRLGFWSVRMPGLGPVQSGRRDW